MRQLNTKDIVKKIIGNTAPVGDSSVDHERHQNLREKIELTKSLIDDLKAVASYKDEQEFSVRESGRMAHDFITELKEELNEG